MSRRARLYARAQHAEQRRRLLIETLEDRRLLTGEMDITNVVPGSQVTHFEAPLAFTEFRNNSFSVNSEEASIRQVKATLTSLHGQISLPGIGSGHSPNFDHVRRHPEKLVLEIKLAEEDSGILRELAKTLPFVPRRFSKYCEAILGHLPHWT